MFLSRISSVLTKSGLLEEALQLVGKLFNLLAKDKLGSLAVLLREGLGKAGLYDEGTEVKLTSMRLG